ncbi:MAG: hypothetical protein AB7R90_17910 [Reyranellaceae bacterium]
MQTENDWQPMTPAEVAALLRGARFPWWIAGGHAIERALGRPLRPHGDIDVLILRRDQMAARDLLAEWDCHVADPPGTLRPWPPGESLRHGVHDVWVRQNPHGKWRLQLMLDEADGDRWRSRRDAHITRPLSELGAPDADGVAFLVPEVQLYYKAARPQPKDQQDFEAVLPRLSPAQKVWLSRAIATSWGRQHRWLPALLPAQSAQ